jgi:trans-aconitate methyltransferase
VASKLAVALGSVLPVPLLLLRSGLQRDNHQENRDGWHRLRHESESARYEMVRSITQKYGAAGFVVDVGCSQGILQEGLTYGRYLGIDSFAEPIARAAVKVDARTSFVQADGASYRLDQPADVVVFNETLYYLPDPLAAVTHYAEQLTSDGVLVVCVYARAWSMRRLLRQIGTRFQLAESVEVQNSSHLAWTVAVFRP